MSTSSIVFIIQWIILLYFSWYHSILKADRCPQKCGNMTLPYPFRLEGRSSCGLPGFEIACNKHLPFLKTLSGDLQVLNISFDHIQINSSQFYATPPQCNTYGNVSTFQIDEKGPFRISERNKFFAIGIDTNGNFNMFLDSNTNKSSFSGSCVSLWGSLKSKTPYLFCQNHPCCMIPVPGGYTKYTLNADFAGYFKGGTCSRSGSTIVDGDMISNSDNSTFEYTMRLDWAISDGEPKRCATNAKPEKKDWGYLCQCKAGYQGDGYTNGTGCIAPATPPAAAPAAAPAKCLGVSCLKIISIVSGLCGALLAVLLGGGALFFILRARKSRADKRRNFHRNGGDQLEELISLRREKGTKLFSLVEIEKATENFSSSLILGSGCYGTVYKGTLSKGDFLAIKKPKEVDSKEIGQFITEFDILTQINHKNVVKLMGCCVETKVPLLVYEYISNGTLFDHLHGNRDNRDDGKQLQWEQRLRIATETAEALSHLHSGISPPIVHRDIKTSNILLDGECNPKVADFGLSRLLSSGETEIGTLVQGTLGYLDPEYLQTNKLTEKSDVYSFGVVLVELLTGMEVVSHERVNNQSNLAIIFLSTLKANGLHTILDQLLNVELNIDSMLRVAKLAQECLSVEGEKRPTMKEVAQKLLWIKSGNRSHAPMDLNVEEISDRFEAPSGMVNPSSVPKQPSTSFSIEELTDGR